MQYTNLVLNKQFIIYQFGNIVETVIHFPPDSLMNTKSSRTEFIWNNIIVNDVKCSNWINVLIPLDRKILTTHFWIVV